MAVNTEKNSYTVIFAIGMVVIVGVILAGLFSWTKPMITQNEEIEKQQNILYAMGINENDESSAVFVSTDVAPEEFASNIKEQMVITVDANGKMLKSQTRDEYMAENNKEPYLIDIKKQKSNAKAGEPRQLPLFVGEKDGKKIYVAPIYGKGLWDAIWGYVAMDEDMVVQGAYLIIKVKLQV